MHRRAPERPWDRTTPCGLRLGRRNAARHHAAAGCSRSPLPAWAAWPCGALVTAASRTLLPRMYEDCCAHSRRARLEELKRARLRAPGRLCVRHMVRAIVRQVVPLAQSPQVFVSAVLWLVVHVGDRQHNHDRLRALLAARMVELGSDLPRLSVGPRVVVLAPRGAPHPWAGRRHAFKHPPPGAVLPRFAAWMLAPIAGALQNAPPDLRPVGRVAVLVLWFDGHGRDFGVSETRSPARPGRLHRL